MTLAPGASAGSLAARIHASLADAPPLGQRLLVVPLARDGARVTTTHVLAEDCQTWEPYSTRFDSPVPIPSGRYTLKELFGQVEAEWSREALSFQEGRPTLSASLYPYADVEVDLVAGSTLRDVAEAVRLTLLDQGGALSWSSTVLDLGGSTPLTVVSVRASRVGPHPPSVPAP